ncbi:hypothetical protein ACSFBX_34955 [Variovorax sp. RB2P76]|uniref:hypothetical protein n=1 Tax=Variovorax sp. RB2P76 TaxID=3443736 RepID=UPI003F48DD03
MSPVERVIELAKAANAKIEATFNAPDVLPFTSDALEVIQDNPDLQADFEEVFLHMGGYAPTEFVEVCMHALRWPNVKQGFERSYRQAVDSNDWRAEPVYRHYLEAFEDDWESEEFYGDYFSRPQAGDA